MFNQLFGVTSERRNVGTPTLAGTDLPSFVLSKLKGILSARGSTMRPSLLQSPKGNMGQAKYQNKNIKGINADVGKTRGTIVTVFTVFLVLQKLFRISRGN